MNKNFIEMLRQTAKPNLCEVTVPRWGRVYIREITVAEVEAQSIDGADKNNKHSIARSAARIMCDKEGNFLVNPDNQDEVNLLASQPWSLLRKVLEAGETFNAKNEEGLAEAKKG